MSRVVVLVDHFIVHFADFAQLLKILLKAQGLEVFLDVDNLANTGAFDDQLWKHLSATKNVVLVWTKGCMGRFLGAEDVAQQDFVRKKSRERSCCSPKLFFFFDFISPVILRAGID
jgi:hypothetical protein